MAARFVVAHGMPGGPVPDVSEDNSALWMLDWTSDRRNAIVDVTGLPGSAPGAESPLLADLMDLVAAAYFADVASPRGRLEEWVRDLEIEVPVRDPGFWRSVSGLVSHLLYSLTRDNIRLTFVPDTSAEQMQPPRAALPQVEADCVSLLSGGLDSMAGAAMLLHTGRRPLLVSHVSGNPTVESAQRRVVAHLSKLGGCTHAVARVLPGGHGQQPFAYPPPEMREPSRRARSLLFMTLGVVAACRAGVSEVYLCENGILTAALPLTPARSGSLSTRSTHPMVLKLFGELLELADIPCQVANPFLHQTKGEVIRTFLRPLLRPDEIADSVSCWSAGRQNRPCGGCIPCLLRRISMLSAGLPDEAFMMDLLATPEEYRGTDAFGNLVDLLTQAGTLLTQTEFQLLLDYPQLLDMEAADVSVHDVMKTLKRHASEVYHVLQTHFPAAYRLMAGLMP